MFRAKPGWLKKLFPWEQKALRVNGRTMAYVDEGDSAARPVLLLSGNPTWGFLYRDFIRPLTDAGFRAIAPDWVGAGYSDHPRLDAARCPTILLTSLPSWISLSCAALSLLGKTGEGHRGWERHCNAWSGSRPWS